MAEGRSRKFGKHPLGLAILAATEFAERFSYYGMTSLLVLYMVKQLLLPGHAEHVLGLSALRGLLMFRGPISDQAFASLIYGWYGGLIYFTPIVGGWVADRWLGKRATVVVGALLMASGHLAMTFDRTFLIALLLLILGSGALKGNISAQVGTLYPPDDESLRTRGFTIFSTAINVGAVVGPLATGAAAQSYGFHRGFGIAAALMLVAVAIYLVGSRRLPADRSLGKSEEALPAMTAEEKRRSWALIGVIALTHTAQHRLSDDLERRHPVGRSERRFVHTRRHHARELVHLGRPTRQHRQRGTVGGAVVVAGAARTGAE